MPAHQRDPRHAAPADAVSGAACASCADVRTRSCTDVTSNYLPGASASRMISARSGGRLLNLRRHLRSCVRRRSALAAAWAAWLPTRSQSASFSGSVTANSCKARSGSNGAMAASSPAASGRSKRVCSALPLLRSPSLATDAIAVGDASPGPLPIAQRRACESFAGCFKSQPSWDHRSLH